MENGTNQIPQRSILDHENREIAPDGAQSYYLRLLRPDIGRIRRRRRPRRTGTAAAARQGRHEGASARRRGHAVGAAAGAHGRREVVPRASGGAGAPPRPQPSRAPRRRPRRQPPPPARHGGIPSNTWRVPPHTKKKNEVGCRIPLGGERLDLCRLPGRGVF